MAIAEHEIQRLIESVWQTAFSMEAFESAPDGAGANEFLHARVSIFGAWRGVAAIACERPLARFAASQMLCIAPGDLVDQDLLDTLGEVANVIAGGLKALLPAPSLLSLPTVDGRLPDFADRTPSRSICHVIARSVAVLHGYRLGVSLVETEQAVTADLCRQLQPNEVHHE